ncbi:MAG: cytochrome c biogenesis protein CcdA [Nocardiopsaceae bacterium]|nr:cytochrome c biogenesis protein CcdA [Nocardiopsaceae bacterium]
MSVGHLVLSGPLLLAVPVAAAAGAVTFLSPCVLPLVPGYLSYVTGMSGVDAQRRGPAGGDGTAAPAASAAASAAGAGGAGGAGGAAGGGAGGVGTAVLADGRAAAASPARHRTLAGVALFVLGFSVVFATEGVAFGGLGSLLRTHSAGLTQILGALTIVLGLLFAGAFDRFPIAGRIMRPSIRPRAGLAGAPVLGVLFGLSWSPCIGPTLTVVMSLAFTSGTAARGAVLMFAYGIGLGVPFLIVALAFQRGMAALAFARRHARAITRIGGALLVVVGVLEVSGAWTAALSWLQTHWIGGYQSPL